MTAPTYDIDERPEINPLIHCTAAETCTAVAAALSWIMAADPDRLTDLAQRDGLSYVMLPAVTALEVAAAREEGCFTLDRTRAARLRAMATQYTGGNLLTAIDQAMDTLEVSKTHACKIDESPEAQRARFERVRDLAQGWIDALDQAAPIAR